MCVCYKNLDEFFEKNPDGRYFYATTKAPHAYHEVEYRDGDYLMFGKETSGLPEALLIEHPERCIRIPMREARAALICLTRSLLLCLRHCGRPALKI